MRAARIVLLAIALIIPFTQLSAQGLRKSHEECLKVVPGDWGPNFGEEWKQHEAVYWGCRLSVPVEIVRQWQEFSSGMIQDLIQVTIDKQQIVLIESMEGSAHCFDVAALRKTANGWELIWSPPSSPEGMNYCTLACSAIRITAHGNTLTLQLPETSDPKEDQTFSCKHIKWKVEKYLWDGQTYQPATATTKSVQTKP